MTDALFEVSRPKGRHAEMLETAIIAARESGLLEAVDGGLLSIARANALALDEAEASPKPYYPIAQLTGPYREVLEALQMTPETREAKANDELTQALRELSQPTVRNA
ncbi:hypothetical protein NLL33_11450 [Corynebacterium accolens]|nr:hypothetical protein [Corynebacterium accolens]WKS67968.1 hypothetical protein NLL33_11450 [Corynebacterium accolens]